MRNATTIEPRQAQPRALGYQFDPIPSALKADRRLGHLNDRDLIVASEMIAMARWTGRDDSVWTTKAVLAQRLGISGRTVQASWARLRSRGWIVEQAVGRVDPLDPRNRTGRRFWFGWVAEQEAEVGPGEKKVAPGGEKVAAPNDRNTRISEETTNRAVVVSPETGISDARPATPRTPDERADLVTPPVESGTHPLPAALVEVMATPTIGEPLRRQLGRMIRRWLAAHPTERVVAALRAMLEAAKRRRVTSPIGFVVGTLRNMEAEGDPASELAPPPPSLRTPDADRTAERLAESRRGQALIAERERRWRALPEADRLAIEMVVDAEWPRPAGVPTRLWALTRHSACLDRVGPAEVGEGSGGIGVPGPG